MVVATSNVKPDDLYRDGLNRALFLPFIALLHRHMDVMRLEARTDFRLEKLAGVPVSELQSLPQLATARRCKSLYASDQVDRIREFAAELDQALETIRIAYAKQASL